MKRVGIRNLRMKPGKVIIIGLSLIGAAGLSVMLIVTVLNISLREFFSSPLYGAVEIVGCGGVLLYSFSIVYCQIQRRQIVVRIVIDRLSPRFRGILEIVTSVIAVFTIAVMTIGALAITFEAVKVQEVTTVMRVQFAPFRAVWAFFCIVLFGVLIQQLYRILSERREK